MSTDNLSELSMSISQISDERGYWFFRSQGGAYYSDFFKYNFIGIGYNEISIKDLTFADEKTCFGGAFSSRIERFCSISHISLKEELNCLSVEKLINLDTQLLK